MYEPARRLDRSGEGAHKRPKHPFKDEAHFIKTLFESPRATGAVSPSGRFLARAMARPVEATGSGLVVELGPGTGHPVRVPVDGGPLGPRRGQHRGQRLPHLHPGRRQRDRPSLPRHPQRPRGT